MNPLFNIAVGMVVILIIIVCVSCYQDRLFLKAKKEAFVKAKLTGLKMVVLIEKSNIPFWCDYKVETGELAHKNNRDNDIAYYINGEED